MIVLNGADLGLYGTPMFGPGLLRINQPSTDAGETGAPASDRVRAAADRLAAALRDLTASTKPSITSRLIQTPPRAASVTGLAARVWTVHGTSSVLETTRAVNTQTNTTRASASPLGLDLSAPAVSVLRSSSLGLDVTSPETSSRLDSSAGLGLDLSAARASSLQSSAAIGLDLTSANAPSTLSSSTRLGLDVTSPQSASTIQSTAEMNAATTTFSAYDVVMSGGTSHAQLSGSYGGTSTSLTVRTNLGSSTSISSSPSSVSVDLLNDANQVIGSYSGSITAEQVVSLGSTGVKFRFTAGSLSLLGSSAKTNVSQTATTVSATAVFDGAWGTAPVFENFQQVTAGSFTVNGVSIAVNANDSINAVVSRINASAAGVTASVSGDKLTLTTNANSEDTIVLANDTSGFLTATKLSGATTTRGNVRDDEQVFAKTTQFASVATGSFTVNGVTIAVSKDTDSLATLISRIDASAAGVTASYDPVADKLVLTTNANSEDLIAVSGDTSGFLSAAHLATANTVRGHLPEDTVVLSDLAAFAGVQNGSFVVDGKTIAVTTSDTVESIVGKINGSGARVSARYDAPTDRIVLDATYNSEDDVPIGSDTSGFLAAAHLAASNTTLGNLPDDQQVLAKTTQFAGVSSGSFDVNGVAIAVDTATDSLETLITRINASGAGVTASFNANANTISLVTNAASEDLIVVDHDSTGFLSTAHLDSANTVRGNIHDDAQVLSKTSQFAHVVSGAFSIRGTTIAIDAATDSLNDVIAHINSSSAGVRASYDGVSDKLVLTRTSADEDAIDVSGDTTGFLAATGLDSLNTVRGNLPDDTQVLSKTSQFASVGSGTVDVNGHSIAIDTSADSLEAILGRINTAGAGVTARYDAGSDRVTVAPDHVTDTLVLDDAGTRFFAALHVATGTAGTHVNVEAPFNGTDANDPLFDPGLSVHAGSFLLNGATISVSATDSINTVLAHINASAAGVGATFDSASQTVRLTTTQSSGDSITFGGDTSGFLAAVKIDGTATSTPGAADASAFAAPLASMSQYASVRAGTLTINGHAIAIDPSTTTVRSLVAALDAADTVHASLDESTGALQLAGDDAATSISLMDTSGILATLGIQPGTVAPVASAMRHISIAMGTERTSNAAGVASRVVSAVSDLNAALTAAGAVAANLDGLVRSLASVGIRGLSANPEASRLDVDLVALTASLDASAEVIQDLAAANVPVFQALG